MAANVYDFQSLGPVMGGTSQCTSGTSAKDSAVASGAVGTISPGDLCIYLNGYWAKLANGEANAAGRYGIARSLSTDTVAADGLVSVEYCASGLLVRGRPTTAANLAQAILGDTVTLDVSGGVQKVDEDDTTNGRLLIKSYDNSVSGSETIDVVLPYMIV